MRRRGAAPTIASLWLAALDLRPGTGRQAALFAVVIVDLASLHNCLKNGVCGWSIVFTPWISSENLQVVTA